MKKILLFIGVIALTILAFPTMAQHFDTGHTCGLKGADAAMVKAQMMQNREEMRDYVHQRGAITYVPIKVHLVADNSGEGRVAEGRALDMICKLNGAYLQHEIQFYLSNGFNYINHTNLYNDPTSTSAFIKMSSEKVNDAINVFVNLTIDTGGTGTTLAYYQPPIGSADWIVITAGNIGSESVLAHEVGHFFSLSHPFIGWENAAWNESDHGNPVNITVGPSTTFTGYTIEFQNGSNCTTAADGICDTPPDYLFGFVQSGCGEFSQEVMDFQGDVVDPMETNLMSYFANCNVYEITTGQEDAVNMSLESNGRNYVNPGVTPNLDEINSIPTLTFPADLATVVDFSSVTLTWDAVPGATQYLFEIDRLNGFGFNPEYIITTDLSQTLTNLEDDRTYYWRVLPFTPYRTCSDYSAVYSFNTDSSVSTTEIASVENWLVRPNPVAKNANVVIEMNSSETFDAEVKIYSLTGQLLSSANNTFAQGASTFEVNTNQLNTGMYIVSVQSAKGVMTQKIVVR